MIIFKNFLERTEIVSKIEAGKESGKRNEENVKEKEIAIESEKEKGNEKSLCPKENVILNEKKKGEKLGKKTGHIEALSLLVQQLVTLLQIEY